MAHIISCMLDAEDGDFALLLNNYIAKAVSPEPSNDSVDNLSTMSSSSEKPHASKMQPERKYQLFPKDKQPAAAAAAAAALGKPTGPEKAFALAMGQNTEKMEKAAGVSGLRIRIKEQTLNRRRKISVPELGPMTTVQEAAMDSPTIPGRPPFHERSISAPGHSWRHHVAEFIVRGGDREDLTPEETSEVGAAGNNAKTRTAKSGTNVPRQPLSPRDLAPLVIPSQSSGPFPRLTRQLSLSRMRSGSNPIEPTTCSARAEDSPKARTPYTPLSASSNTPKSAVSSSTASTTSTLPTPISALTTAESRASPRPWEKPTISPAAATTNNTKEASSETASAPKSEQAEANSMPAAGHRRNQSDTGSIMERGRPRKRTETPVSAGVKRSASKRSRSEERRAFEQLPKGWKASEAANGLKDTEMLAIRRQALQQAARFEVLRKEDVDELSKELRRLDERTEYLRCTYSSLRAGRRNLHTRICQYLRSPRTAKFSHEAMLKQEEALVELDASIEDWATKLEQAENRRTRVRQKLLEHVAAAVTLALPSGAAAGLGDSLQLAMGPRAQNGVGNIATPPRSPTKTTSMHTPSSSPSPQRAIAGVPSTIFEQPLFEDEAAATMGLALAPKESDAATTLRRAETIRIYADNDVYALLADVENEFSKMGYGEMPTIISPAVKGGEGSSSSPSPSTKIPRKPLLRARSHEVFGVSNNKSGLASADCSKSALDLASTAATSSATSSASPAVPSSSSPSVESVTSPADRQSSQIFLTSAVFQPEKSVLAL